MEINSFKNRNQTSNVRLYPMAKKTLEKQQHRLSIQGLPPKSLQDLVNEAVMAQYSLNTEVENG